MTVSERVAARFEGIPSVTPVDIDVWIREAIAESGLMSEENENDDSALVFLAYAIGCESIATSAASYFSYKDADESVDKRNVFENYMKLAAWARKQFDKCRGGGAAFQTFPARGDGK